MTSKIKSTNTRIEDAKAIALAASASALATATAAEEVSVVTEAPTAVVVDRGKFITIDGGAGVADIVKICVKGTDDLYSYKTVTIS